MSGARLQPVQSVLSAERGKCAESEAHENIRRPVYAPPFYGVCKMTAHLRQLGHLVNEKRVRRLLRQMGLEAVYPKPKLSLSHPAHKVFPYLLRGGRLPGAIRCGALTLRIVDSVRALST